MPETKQRPRTWLIVVSLALALCILAAAWIIDYMGKFGMFSKGIAISAEVDAELSRRGLECGEGSALLIPDRALDHEESSGQNRFISSFSLLRSGSSLAADVRLTRIQPSAPWLEGVREGEVIRLRFQCMKQKLTWCIETDDVVRRFHGPSLRGCPDS